MAYWFNIVTKQVETDDNRARDEDVMGPYATEQEAHDAFATARKRTEEWDQADREWEGDEPPKK
ncbi:methionine aminopeptidase [Arsenicicoccus piscis]|uniref:methionine aminopeptidase n=1 Tax=Arsenicicoccus piscis TaxID=673954 RepID=UPI001F4CE735|nr:methionine aminopeptidase [Arsenicicoccus piscis]MCH8628459.1 methionine aminopeptidase [Arsenicicoccus piscis]